MAGVNFIPALVPVREFARKAEEFKVKTGTLKSGVVAKAKTLLEYTSDGKLQPHSGIAESAIVTFGSALTNGQTLILAGLTWTAGSSGTTVAQLVTAWKDITTGATYSSLSARTGGGSFTAGTFTGYYSEGYSTDSVLINYSLATTDGTNIAATGTGSAVVSDIDINTSSFPSTFKVPAGLLLFDMDTTSGDAETQIIIEASYWAEAIVWAVDVDSDYILKGDDTKVFCTAYNTGAGGTSKASNRLKNLLLAQTEISIEVSQIGDL